MKKNKMMRIASALLVLTLITTCAISATFAKYVTTDSASDSARVAKFGVTLTATDASGFATEYATTDSKYDGELSVKSSDEDSLVAPGTASAGAQTYTISGTPEVATKVDIAMTVTEDVWLKTETDDEGKAILYTPVVFTLKQGETKVAEGTLEDIKAAVEGYAATAYYAPNTDLAATFSLTWAWAFESGNDAYDTLLGDLAAGVNTDDLEDGVDYNLDIEYSITFTVTQID